jgi:hypothetical protein
MRQAGTYWGAAAPASNHLGLLEVLLLLLLLLWGAAYCCS